MDQSGYTDDPSIPNSARLWRRIPPWHIVYDQNLGRSAAFDNDPDNHPMSVILEDDVQAAGRDPHSVLTGHKDFAVIDARACGQGVCRDPLPDEPAHVLVFGPKPKSVQRRLAKASVWLIPPSVAAT
jgi:hypothetical protein